MAGAYLLAEKGPLTGQRFDLSGETMTIGRETGEIRVQNKHVSKQHARITRDGEAYYLADLQSRNETRRNGERVESEPVRLRDGDRINIAKVCVFVFRCPAADEQVADDVFRDDGHTAGSELGTSPSHGTSDPIRERCPSLRRLEAKLAALVEIARHLGHTLALGEVLPQVLNGLFTIFPQADRGFIILKTGDGQLDARWKQVRGARGEVTGRISRKIVRYVMESKQRFPARRRRRADG